MEQIIIDFVTKASELVLHNRLPTPHTKDTTTTNKPVSQFQLNFEQKFNFYNRIPPEWSAQTNKLLVVEFFLCLKATNTRFLVEQWIFDLSQISGKKLEDTIDSPQTLYKKLSVLLRTISMLSVTLPLFQKVNKNKEDNGTASRQAYTIEHSINFTRHTLSSWHPSVYDDKDVYNFTSPDFVLPGRAFTFKVNYSKTFKFLQKFQEQDEQLVMPEDFYIKSPHNNNNNSKPITTEDLKLKELSLARRAYSDSYYNKEKRTNHLLTMYLNDSPSEGNGWQANGGDYENFYQAGTIPMPLQVCAQISPRDAIGSPASRKSSGSKGLDISKAAGTAQRLRVKTLESESLWDAEVYICENEEDKFTEVLSWKELSMRNKSPARLSILQKERDEYLELQAIRKFSEDFEKSKRKLSSVSKSIEKIIEQTDDDRIAELIHSIEELKVLARTQSSRDSVNSGTTAAKTDRESSQGTGRSEGKKGLRFETTNSSSRKESGEELLNPFVELNELRELYLLMKRPSSAK